MNQSLYDIEIRASFDFNNGMIELEFPDKSTYQYHTEECNRLKNRFDRLILKAIRTWKKEFKERERLKEMN